jgi:4-amino-4-deoxy-L-arabinose transferase-like glycosyltransferase
MFSSWHAWSLIGLLVGVVVMVWWYRLAELASGGPGQWLLHAVCARHRRRRQPGRGLHLGHVSIACVVCYLLADICAL